MGDFTEAPFLHGPIAAALGITGTQTAQIHDILHAAQPALQPLIDSLVQGRRALHTTIQTTPVNEQAIRAQAAKVATLEADLAVQRAYLHEKIQALLTPDQIQRIRQVEAAVEKKVDNGIGRFEKWIKGPGGQ